MSYRRRTPGWIGVLLVAALSLVLGACDLLPGRMRGANGTSTAAAGPTDTTSAGGAAATPAGSRASRRRGAHPTHTRKAAPRTDVATRSTASAPPPGPAPGGSAAPDPDSAVLPPPAPVLDPLTGAMRDDLRRLVSAQKQHFANQGQYSTRLADLAIRYLPHAGVSVQITSAGTAGWTGRAVADARPGTSCVVWVGNGPRPATDAQHRSPAAAGVPVCDSL